jgi:hypothetical protein
LRDVVDNAADLHEGCALMMLFGGLPIASFIALPIAANALDNGQHEASP